MLELALFLMLIFGWPVLAVLVGMGALIALPIAAIRRSTMRGSAPPATKPAAAAAEAWPDVAERYGFLAPTQRLMKE